ncbi:MAG: hypothetical protein ACW99G_11445 [Candidatus Thorarchaeota archaeon]|jgi:hypothetical protein
MNKPKWWQLQAAASDAVHGAFSVLYPDAQIQDVENDNGKVGVVVTWSDGTKSRIIVHHSASQTEV